MITKLHGSTYRMLEKDKRVANIAHSEDGLKVLVSLAPGWQCESGTRETFDNWEAARNWVRKAKQVDEVVA